MPTIPLSLSGMCELLSHHWNLVLSVAQFDCKLFYLEKHGYGQGTLLWAVGQVFLAEYSGNCHAKIVAFPSITISIGIISDSYSHSLWISNLRLFQSVYHSFLFTFLSWQQFCYCPLRLVANYIFQSSSRNFAICSYFIASLTSVSLSTSGG